MMSEITYDLTAKITLLPTSMGGRKKPVYDGYRPSFVFNTRHHYSGQINLLDLDELLPGNSARVRINLIPARTLRKNLKPQDSFTITEGSKPVGMGTIESVVIA